MNKRGINLSFETVVVAIIVLVVLGVVVSIFITQSGKYVGKYDEIAGNAEKEAKGCSMLFGRYCAESCGDDKNLGKFDDCASNKVCCEKKSENA